LVTLSGRVGTDAEVRVAEALLDDVLDLDDFANDLVVDELRRGDLPEAPDDAAAEVAERGDLGGDDRSQQTDTADHLVEDLDSDMLGTRDMGRAIRDGTAYNPPDQPVSDGYGSREDH